MLFLEYHQLLTHQSFRSSIRRRRCAMRICALVVLIVALFAPTLAEAGDERTSPFAAIIRQADKKAPVSKKESVCLLPGDAETLWFTRWEGRFWNRDYPNFYSGTISMILKPRLGGARAVIDYNFPDIGKRTGRARALIVECKLRVAYKDTPNTYSLTKRGNQFIFETFSMWGSKRNIPIQVEMLQVGSPLKLARPSPEISMAPTPRPGSESVASE